MSRSAEAVVDLPLDLAPVRGRITAGAMQIFVEALQNAAEHAGAGASATVVLGQDRDGVHFSVEDDGVGFEADAVEPGGGLTNLADRAAAAGGSLRIESAPGRGTRVVGWLPG